MLLWVMSDRAIPRSFRFMEGFGVHTFRFVTNGGKSTFVKFHWKPKLGLQSVVWNEAVKINGADPDFHRRDLWTAIQSGDFPEWELGVQLFDDAFADDFAFDVLDATKIIPKELVPVRRMGRLVLNRTVDNFFAETEQVAFCTQNVVPGIDFTNDPLLQGRNFSYLDTQTKRLGGPNFTYLPVNAPKCPFAHFQQDGHDVTQLGGTVVVILSAVAVAIVETIRTRRPAAFSFLVVAFLGVTVIVNVTKWLVDRTRPNIDRLVGFSGPSFPSGHAATAAAVYAAFALLLGRGRPYRLRRGLGASAAGIAAAVAATRVLLGVHWVTDVVAGLLIGWAWFALCSIAFGGHRLRFGAPVTVAQQIAEEPPQPGISHLAGPPRPSLHAAASQTWLGRDSRLGLRARLATTVVCGTSSDCTARPSVGEGVPSEPLRRCARRRR